MRRWLRSEVMRSTVPPSSFYRRRAQTPSEFGEKENRVTVTTLYYSQKRFGLDVPLMATSHAQNVDFVGSSDYSRAMINLRHRRLRTGAGAGLTWCPAHSARFAANICGSTRN